MTRVVLSSICERIDYGYTASATKEKIGPHFLRITDITGERIDWSKVPYCRIESKLHSKYKLELGDIVIARTGATSGWGKYVKQDEDSVFASYLVRLRIDKAKALPRYVGFAVESYQYKKFIQSTMGGAAQPNANAKTLTRYEIYLPSIADQAKISHTLESYDDLIENNSKRIEKLESMARLLYRHTVQDIETSTTLGSQISPRKGKNITKATIKKGDVPVVAGGLTPAYYHDTPNTKSPVITVSASGANAGFVNLYHQDIWASDCSFIDNNITPFVYYYFTVMKERQFAITHMQKGSAQPHVYPTDLEKLVIPELSKEKIAELSNNLNPIYEQIRNLTLRNEILTKARDMLLPRLMSGDIEA